MIKFIKKTFTLRKLRHLILGETIGKFLAFLIGLGSSRLFTYQVLERRSIHNLFGIMHRKQVVVHRTPYWVEILFAAFIGFLAMELFNYILQTKNNKRRWRKILRSYVSLKWKLKR